MAEIIHTTTDAAHRVVPLPAPDDGEALERLANRDDLETLRTCSVDGQFVRVWRHGDSDYGRCDFGHTWEYNFDPVRPGWIDTAREVPS